MGKEYSEGWEGAFWRFDVTIRTDVNCWLIRDCDSRINYREVAAVKEWLESDYDFHVMRDHPTHEQWPIMGGMWGGKCSIPEMQELIDAWPHKIEYGDDQRFLAEKIWPLIKDRTLVHGRGGKPWPWHRPLKGGYGFVGQRHNEYGDPECKFPVDKDSLS
jgi:hypothetical protein